MNRAGRSADNMKRECRAISAVAMLDQHKRQGHYWCGLRGSSGESYMCACVRVFVCVTKGECLCVLRVSICVCVCSLIHIYQCVAV